MLAGPHSIVHDGGSTLSTTFALTNAAGVATNLTGYKARMQVRSTWLVSGSVLATFGTTAPDTGLTIPTPTDGKIVLGPIDRTLLTGIPANGERYVWDMFIYLTGGEEIRVLFGTFTMRPFSTEVP